MPERAPELAVGDALQAGILLLLDHALDRLVFDRFQRRVVDLAALMLRARLFQFGGPQQAANVLRAKGRIESHQISLEGVRSARHDWLRLEHRCANVAAFENGAFLEPGFRCRVAP